MCTWLRLCLHTRTLIWCWWLLGWRSGDLVVKSVGQVITRPTVGWLCAEHSCTKRLTPASHTASPFISDHCLVELNCGGVDPYVPVSISDLLQRVVVVPSPRLCCCLSRLFSNHTQTSHCCPCLLCSENIINVKTWIIFLIRLLDIFWQHSYFFKWYFYLDKSEICMMNFKFFWYSR